MTETDLRTAAKSMGTDAATLLRIEQGRAPSAKTLTRILFWLLSTIALQAASIQIVVTHQPVVSFQAVYGTKLPSVGLYQVRACSDQPVSLSGSRVLTMAARHVAVIDQALIPASRSRARQRSWKWRAARMATWAGLLGALVTTGGAASIVAVTPAIAQSMPIISMIADRLGTEVSADEALAGAVVLIGEADRWTLEAGGCKSGLTWARWFKGQAEIVTEVVTAP